MRYQHTKHKRDGLNYRTTPSYSGKFVYKRRCVDPDVLNSLGNSRYFSTIDCEGGFYQIPLRAEDRPKTAFSTDYGHFEYKSMPFGLKGAPATFQRLMSVVLSGMQGLKSLCYLDILIFGETLEVHNDRLRNVFVKLRITILILKSPKEPCACPFYATKRSATTLGVPTKNIIVGIQHGIHS